LSFIDNCSQSSDETSSQVYLHILLLDAAVCAGSINFNEFLQFLLDKRRLSEPETDMRNAFRLFDKDADGYLTSNDLKQVSLAVMFHIYFESDH